VHYLSTFELKIYGRYLTLHVVSRDFIVFLKRRIEELEGIPIEN